MKLNLYSILVPLFLIYLLVTFNSGCSCSTDKSKDIKTIVNSPKIVKAKFIGPLSTYIKEVKLLKKRAKRKTIQQMRAVYTSHKEIMSKRGDFVIMHTFLKNGANLFKNGKYDEALEEFTHVINQYPEDMNLQAIATKNISICYKKKRDMKNYIKYYTKYYELLDEIPEDEDDY